MADVIEKTMHMVFLATDQGPGSNIATHVCNAVFNKKDPNQGLPDFFFEGDYIAFELDDAGFVEWVPACGPAPCWKRRLSDFKSHDEMLAAWDIWFRETY